MTIRAAYSSPRFWRPCLSRRMAAKEFLLPRHFLAEVRRDLQLDELPVFL